MPAIIATPELLADARTKYHQLVTGSAPRVVVDQNGERVEFAAANKTGLYNYIQQLEQALRVPCGASPTFPTNIGPAGFTF